ncbi:autotransporter outer membrane beta-barrel domain-containing protein [Pseudomonas entomophila]|uniref:autotransporter outer membrane beta-barrel domain-containing protein n=1 Tax=Pseudomonas entomophila TaxID=312306 RepID=UPI0023D7B96D|nr:autotransporter outer membrane beta-barrel domain-containing protein [Pseudomonas entomophila]MDF0731125.1 autotransporter outer membrane beta-barrel domain-containing protein [Pseudomonas entomophila]
MTITPAEPRTNYVLINQSLLTVNGGQTSSISVNNSRLNILSGDSQVTNGTAISLVDSQANIANAAITSTNGVGLLLAHSAGAGSSATVLNSRIQGGTAALQVNADGVLDISGSQMTATAANGNGMRLQGGTARVTGSSITGQGAGVWMLTEIARPTVATLNLDGSSVSSVAGPGVDVRTRSDAIIDLRNRSSITSGNGTAVVVAGFSNLALTAADSAITGNVSVLSGGRASLDLRRSILQGDVTGEAGSTVSLALADDTRMTGNVSNVQSLTLDSGAQLTGSTTAVAQASIGSDARWTMIGNSDVGDLAINDGTVVFGDGSSFHTLTVNNLSGTGNFHMNGDFVTGQADQLVVTGSSSGNHGLLMASSGQEASVQSLRLVQTADGGAQFHLLNTDDKVEVGAFSYGLKQDGTDWVLDRETRTVAPITLSAMALFNTPITVAYGELSSLRSRMGELRYSEGRNAGLWMRGYGNQYNVSGSTSGAGYQQNQRGLSLGADLQLGESDWLLGVLAGSSRSDLNLAKGSSGSVDSYYLGGYATWLDRETGYYVDTVVKYNRYQNNAKVGMSDGSRSKGDYDTHGVSASVEAGKHIKLDDGYFVEPFAQVATVVVAGKDYSFSNGLRAEGDTAKSVLGKVGATVGKTIPLDGGGMLQPYLKAAYAHEFAQRNEVRVNDNRFNNDLSGSRGELGAGVAWQVSKQFQVHADVEYSNGKHIEQPYGVNLGVRFEF